MLTMFIFIEQTLWRKRSFLSVLHLGPFLGFLDSWKKDISSPYFCLWGFNNGFSLSAWTFFQLFIWRIWNILLVDIMVAEMAVLGSLKPGLLFLILLVRSLVHFVPAFPDWLPSFQKQTQNVMFCFAKYSVDIESGHGQNCYRIWTLNGKRWKVIFFHLSLHVVSFCVLGIAGLRIWACWWKYHTLNSWRMILFGEDRVCGRWWAKTGELGIRIIDSDLERIFNSFTQSTLLIIWSPTQFSCEVIFLMTGNTILYEEVHCWIFQIITFLKPAFGRIVIPCNSCHWSWCGLWGSTDKNLVPLWCYSF